MCGFAAGASLLWTYQHTHNLKTLRQIFNRWAPPDDTVGSLLGNPANQPNKYASFVGERCGVSTTAPLVLFQPSGSVIAQDLLLRLLLAMAHYECGKPWPDPRDAERGIALYQKAQPGGPESPKPEPPAPPAQTPDALPLRLGSKGPRVTFLQEALNRIGGFGLKVDGKFGPKTVAALKSTVTID
jgi:hypothetical protein